MNYYKSLKKENDYMIIIDYVIVITTTLENGRMTNNKYLHAQEVLELKNRTLYKYWTPISEEQWKEYINASRTKKQTTIQLKIWE